MELVAVVVMNELVLVVAVVMIALVPVAVVVWYWLEALVWCCLKAPVQDGIVDVLLVLAMVLWLGVPLVVVRCVRIVDGMCVGSLW